MLKPFQHTQLHFRECADRTGFFEVDEESVSLLRTRMEMLQFTGSATTVGEMIGGLELAVRQLDDRIAANTVTQVPLEWVVRLQNDMPFFEAEVWRREHVAQEHRRLLWRPPYFEPGDTVTLFGSVADFLGERRGKTYTVLEIDDRWLSPQTGGLPTLLPDPGIARLYRLDGLQERVSHCALRVAEPRPFVRLFQGEHQANDVRIVAFATRQRQSLSLGPTWEMAPSDEEWLQWWIIRKRPLYLLLTVEQAQQKVTGMGLPGSVAFLELDAPHEISGEIEHAFACDRDGQHLCAFRHFPWQVGLFAEPLPEGRA
jgi:hypothetical protein